MQIAYEIVDMIMQRSMKLSVDLDQLDEQLNTTQNFYMELEAENQSMRKDKGLDAKNTRQIRRELQNIRE